MSIRFAFGAKVRKKEALIQAVRSLAESGGQTVQEDNDHIWISFCPMGGISMIWEHENGLLGQWVISGECYSTPAGQDSIRRRWNLWMHWANPSLRA